MPSSDRFSDLRAVYVNCTLKPSPELSHTAGLMDVSTKIMRDNGVTVDEIRAVDHDIAPGVQPDMREHGCTTTTGPLWRNGSWPLTSSSSEPRSGSATSRASAHA